MIVSIAIEVLPVWRSPMISSRWPRPIGIIESIALSPVSIGSLTGWRWTTPGALCSPFAAPKARQIGRIHAASSLDEIGRQTQPVLGAPAQPVYQHHGSP